MTEKLTHQELAEIEQQTEILEKFVTAVRGAKEAIEDFEVPEGIIWTELERQTETLNNFAKASGGPRREGRNGIRGRQSYRRGRIGPRGVDVIRHNRSGGL